MSDSGAPRVRLRRSDAGRPGITRRRCGKGWVFTWPDGSRVSEPEELERIRSLALPPAWRDVWICPWANGHIQALGTDAAGRRQYRYHDAWRTARDAAKHDRVLDFAARLPYARERVRGELTASSLTRRRVLATTFRLLDLGFFRVGSELYAEENNTYGLATMRREHVTVADGLITFEYTAKHGKQRVQSVADDDVCSVISELLRREDPSPELFAYDADGAWRDVKSAEINAFLHDVLGTEVSAKDFRTWHATVLMAVALAVSAGVPESPSARKRAISRAVTEVSQYLGNTPAVCRSSYIDPRIIDLYNDGLTVAPALERLGADASFGQPATHGQLEACVLELLRGSNAADRRRLARRKHSSSRLPTVEALSAEKALLG